MLLPDTKKLSPSGKRLLKKTQEGKATEKDRFTASHFKDYLDYCSYEDDLKTEGFLDQFSEMNGELRTLNFGRFSKFARDISDRLAHAEEEIDNLRYRLDNV